MQIFRARIIPFGQTLAAWTSSNPTPYQGEFVFESGASPTDFKFKIGDGLTPYNSLPYQSSGGGGGGGNLQQTLNLGTSASDISGGQNRINLLDSATTGNSTYGSLAYVLENLAGQAVLECQIGFFGGEVNIYDLTGVFCSKLSVDGSGGLLKLLNSSTGFSESVTTNPLNTGSRIFLNPDMSGVYALEGDGNNPTLTCTSGSGVATGATAIPSTTLSDNKKAAITLTTGSVPIAGPPTGTAILVVTYATPYPTGSIPITTLQANQNNTVDLINNCFISTYSETGFTIYTKNTYTVPPATTFNFSYSNQL